MIDKQKQIEEKIELLKSTEKAIHGIMFSDTIIVYVLPDTTDQKLQVRTYHFSFLELMSHKK